MCKVCGTPARSRAVESSANALAVAIDRALAPAAPAPAAPAIKLADVVRVAGEKRRAIVVDRVHYALSSTGYYIVMFRDGSRSEHKESDLTYVAPALGK